MITQTLQTMLDEAGDQPCNIAVQLNDGKLHEGAVKDTGSNGIMSLMGLCLKKPVCTKN